MSGKTIAAIRVDQVRISPAHRQSGRFVRAARRTQPMPLTTHGGFVEAGFHQQQWLKGIEQLSRTGSLM